MTQHSTGTALHADAKRVLADWAAPDARQRALRAEYRQHLTAHPDAMRRSCGAGHLTASALVVDPARGRVLLTLHRKLHRWLQTGGHCEEGDATLADAALREAAEESGLTGLRLLGPAGQRGVTTNRNPVGGAVPVRLDRHHTPCAWHLDVQYAALAPEGAQETVSAESVELRWFAYDEVADVADASVQRLVERTLDLLSTARSTANCAE